MRSIPQPSRSYIAGFMSVCAAAGVGPGPLMKSAGLLSDSILNDIANLKTLDDITNKDLRAAMGRSDGPSGAGFDVSVDEGLDEAALVEILRRAEARRRRRSNA